MQIKELIELTSGISDIDKLTRKRDYIYLRIVYYRLCRDFCNKKLYPLAKIGFFMGGKDHSSVIHALKTFEDLKDQKTFKETMVTYDLLYRKIVREIGEKTSVDLMSKEELTAHFRVKHIELVNKSHKTINSLKEKLSRIRRIRVLDEISELNEKDMNKFDYVVRNFLHKTKGDKWKEKLQLK